MATLRGMIMPDVIGSFNQGREVGEEQRTKRTLSQFMQPAIGGDQQALSEIYRADPQAGYRVQQAATQEQEQALGREDKRKERLGQMARQLIALPEAMRPAAYRQLIPELSTFGLETVPPDYTSEVDDVVRQVAEALAPQTANKMFSQKIGANGNILNTLADGRVVDTGIKADRQAWFRDQPGMDPTIVNKDGSTITPGAPPPQAAPTDAGSTVFRTSTGELLDVSQVADPVMRAEIISNPAAYGLLSDAGGGSVELPPVERQAAPIGGALQARPLMTPAQEQQMEIARQANQRAAEAAEASKRGNAPTGFRFKADGSLEPIPGGPKPAGAAATEGERKAATLLARLSGSLTQLQQSVTEDPGAASPGLMPTAVGAVFGATAANAITPSNRQRVEAAQLDILDAALTLGTGAAYTREQLEGYRKSFFPQIGDSKATIQDKSARLDNVIAAAKIAAGRAGPKSGGRTAQPSRPTSESEYNALPSGALFIDPDDGKTYRKP